MRVWLVEKKAPENPASLEPLLRQVAQQWGSAIGLDLVLAPSPPAEAVPAEAPDVLVLTESVCPDAAGLEQFVGLGCALLLATNPDGWARFHGVAEVHPVWFIPARPEPEALWLALLSARAGQRRHAHWKGQAERLEQRLLNRIVIEKAKGLMVQRLHISEEEAYQRLRALSRRQRRPMRDIAQSLLDAGDLLAERPETPAPPSNGHLSRKPDAHPPAQS
jgi:hypothetical protein